MAELIVPMIVVLDCSWGKDTTSCGKIKDSFPQIYPVSRKGKSEKVKRLRAQKPKASCFLPASGQVQISATLSCRRQHRCLWAGRWNFPSCLRGCRPDDRQALSYRHSQQAWCRSLYLILRFCNQPKDKLLHTIPLFLWARRWFQGNCSTIQRYLAMHCSLQVASYGECGNRTNSRNRWSNCLPNTIQRREAWWRPDLRNPWSSYLPKFQRCPVSWSSYSRQWGCW